MGGACQAMADGKTKTETLHKPRDLNRPAHLYLDSQPCVKNVHSANGKPHLLFSALRTTFRSTHDCIGKSTHDISLQFFID